MSISEPTGSPVDDLAERFWEAMLELNPTLATFYGDDRVRRPARGPEPGRPRQDARR